MPNFLIIGAQKCGTTSLHYYLSMHPEICMPRQKELGFFVDEHNWGKGIDWYRRQFVAGFHSRGEASPAYTAYPRFCGVPERIHRILPDAKLIYLVRDPIRRLVSHYVHRLASGNENRSFGEALTDLHNSNYVWRSRYAAQLSRYLPYFAPDRILVITQEELLARRFETVRRVFRFLGVDEMFQSRQLARKFHRTDGKRRYRASARAISAWIAKSSLPRLWPHAAWHLERLLCHPFSSAIDLPLIDDKLRNRLRTIFEKDIARLCDVTGREYREWTL